MRQHDQSVEERNAPDVLVVLNEYLILLMSSEHLDDWLPADTSHH